MRLEAKEAEKAQCGVLYSSWTVYQGVGKGQQYQMANEKVSTVHTERVLLDLTEKPLKISASYVRPDCDSYKNKNLSEEEESTSFNS